MRLGADGRVNTARMRSVLPIVPMRPRVRLRHQVLRLDDGPPVGVSVGGRGVPLVFLHGLGLNGRAYVRLLSRLGGLGFTVIAIDAAGHGGTPNLPGGAATFDDRVDLTLRALDALGVDRAVFLGHSMGGRMIVDLASRAPQRVLAAVLLNAAAGMPFDASLAQARSPRAVARALLAALVDASGDPRSLPRAELARYVRLTTAAVARNARVPLGSAGALRAIMGSGDFAAKLDAMRHHRVPTVVVHGEKDGVVPFANAVDMAERADAALYRVRGAHHSWMLAHPDRAADVMRHLLGAEIGFALRADAAAHRLDDARVHYLDTAEAAADVERLRPAHRPRRIVSVGLAG